MSAKGRVLMAMSGGIDSSIAALLLHEKGYEVIGFTLKTWDYESSCSSKKETGCCSLDSINDARDMAVKLGVKHYVIDVREEFNKFIVDDFIHEYLSGRTPNPCVLCNTHIKWELLLSKANMLDCEYISTGHYARVREENNRAVLYKGVDESKDQSYVLWGLKQEYLKRTLFPLGEMFKQDIRKIATNLGFDNLAKKSESYEICFIPDNDYRSFLNHKIEGLSTKFAGGDFITTTGKFLGKHKGFPFYTIGQRKGLNIATGIPLYVLEIIPDTNTIVLGEKDELKKNSMFAGKINMIKYKNVPEKTEVLTKIRYKDKGALSYLKMEGDNVKVDFVNEVNAIAPGQSAVFYEKDDVVGGGIIL
ncbi:MAG: tRNA 2-thiouridine(34) synthase MnmA [Bacteroidetes bacterium]|nr:tRNA 2-thiouridine(34) synthase MnmA [Bacteroidota bacterium]